jgi:hypothetical protein
MVNQATPVTGLFMHILYPALSLCLFKPTAHVCSPKTAEDGLSAPSASSQGCPKPCDKPPLAALPGLFRGWWQDLYVESQEFGTWVQNSSFTSISRESRFWDHSFPACR